MLCPMALLLITLPPGFGLVWPIISYATAGKCLLIAHTKNNMFIGILLINRLSKKSSSTKERVQPLIGSPRIEIHE